MFMHLILVHVGASVPNISLHWKGQSITDSLWSTTWQNTRHTKYLEVQCLCPQFKPDRIMIDFKLATLNTADTVFPRATRTGCLFHLGQSLYWSICHLRYKVRYDEDAAFQHQINILDVSVFLPADLVGWVTGRYSQLFWTNLHWCTDTKWKNEGTENSDTVLEGTRNGRGWYSQNK